MYNIIIIKVKEKEEIKNKKYLKIQITIYKQINLMYNINIIKVKEIGGKSMLYSKENYETYFGIVNTLQSMDRNATYDEILEEEEGNLKSSILIIKDSLTNLIEEIGEEEAIDYLPVLERVEAFMENNEIEE